MGKNLVIGIEGLVGTGKTSICKELLKYIPNSIVLHAGNVYRAITYQIIKENIPFEKMKSVDLKKLFEKFEISIKIEDGESVVYAHGKKIDDSELQSLENSMAVSKISNMASNDNAYKIVREYIRYYNKDYNIIFSGRDTIKIYPEIDYHFFLKADIDKRAKWKTKQYDDKVDEKKVKENILKRDELQEKSGYYEIYNNTIVIDVSDSKSVEESTKMVLKNIIINGKE
ncbi:MAG: hypothetical protein HFJ25_01800 [Clostridia bacterium]|jgi:cytidylate kinase|nr:hypothetical protein [Clostridia bacterium]